MKAIVWSKYQCPYCDQAKALLNSKGMQMIPSVFTANPKGSYRLNTSSIALYADTDDSVKMKYLEATTGIKVPEKKIILG
mgnify:CR=1 FL=1